MGEKRRAADRAGRPAMRSPGRPPVGRLEHRQRFWAAIACGVSSEDAAVRAGVSPAVGVGWFREGGGMPCVTLAPASGRYLSFAEREEIALVRARGAGVREIARQLGRSPSTISRELRRNAATRGGGLEYRDHRPVARRHAGAAPQAREVRRDPRVAPLCAGPPVGGGAAPGRDRGRRPAGEVDRAAATAGGRTGAGRGRGARSRSRAACAWTSPMITRCASPMRRSTNLSTCRAAARCAAS